MGRGRIADCPGQIAYLILDAKRLGRALPTALPPIRADTVAALATALGLDAAALETTVRDFNAAIAAAGDGPVIDHCTTGLTPPKSHFAAALAVPTFAAYPLRPGVTFTHFGVAVDDRLRIVRADGRPVRNVFAAGMIMAANVLGEGYLAGLASRSQPCSGALPARRLRGGPGRDDFRRRAARDPTMDADIDAITPPAWHRRPRASPRTPASSAGSPNR